MIGILFLILAILLNLDIVIPLLIIFTYIPLIILHYFKNFKVRMLISFLFLLAGILFLIISFFSKNQAYAFGNNTIFILYFFWEFLISLFYVLYQYIKEKANLVKEE